jgi:lipopolysaccharide/colanic/teichoic acid biosynthesis glycosyltransferase
MYDNLSEKFARQEFGLGISPGRRPHVVLTAMILAASDLMALVMAIFLASLLRLYIGRWFPIDLHGEMYAQVLTAILFLPAAYAAAGLYPGYGHTAVERLRKRTTASIACFAAMILFDYLTQRGQWSRGVLLMAGAITLVIGPVWEAATRHLLRRYDWWGEAVAVFGPAEKRRPVIDALRQSADLGWIPAVEGDIPLPGVPALPGISLALVVPPDGGLALSSFADTLPYQRVVLIPDIDGSPSLWVSVRDLDARLGLEMRRNLLVPTSQAIKRAMDLWLGGIALILVTPVIAGFALLVQMKSPGPVFYGQERLGRNSVPFRMWKLRSMRPDAEQLLSEVIAQSPLAHNEWQRSLKLRDDPRIVPGIGHFIRRFSIDELPQLWNVLCGEMSLVGPRPLPQYHLDCLDPVTGRFRAQVRPGVTGLWQVSGRSEVSVSELARLDAYYLRNWSLWLDVHILARTVVVVLNGRGAH